MEDKTRATKEHSATRIDYAVDVVMHNLHGKGLHRRSDLEFHVVNSLRGRFPHISAQERTDLCGLAIDSLGVRHALVRSDRDGVSFISRAANK